MNSVLGQHGVLVAYWLLLIVAAAFFLRLACGLCRTDLPSWRRALVSVVVVTFLAYLAFDFTAYMVLRSMAGVVIQVPPGYGYHLWFREPIGLKLAVLAHAGPLHYVPFVFGLCAAGVLQVIVLQAEVSFRFGLLICLLQWGATAVAGYVLALLFGVGLGALGWAPGAPAAQEGRPAVEQGAEGAAASPGASFSRAAENLKAYASSHLAEVKEDLAPVTKRLPESVQSVLDRGGWWVLLGALAVVVLLWLRGLLRRLVLALSRPRRRKKKRRTKTVAVNLKEDLRRLGEAYTEEGPQRLTVKGIPARLRLVVLALGARNTGELNQGMADRVLDWIKAGLADVTSCDYPRVRVWPPFYSFDGFATAFASNVPIPGPKGEPSRWVLVSGQVKMGLAVIQVGLALYADEDNTLRNLKVTGERWLDVLGVKDERRAVGAR
ncbi:MAG TPA: hypothetical protein VFE78_27330 [Gemmataceae bacterium]|jgi:hypothetical protein|nr:hypothetical protein [Gemmataceae bacterium]